MLKQRVPTAAALILMITMSMFIGSVFAAEPIRLGVAGPHSGDLASYGIPTIKAAELVVKDINAKGGVLGRTGRAAGGR